MEDEEQDTIKPPQQNFSIVDQKKKTRFVKWDKVFIYDPNIGLIPKHSNYSLDSIFDSYVNTITDYNLYLLVKDNLHIGKALKYPFKNKDYKSYVVDLLYAISPVDKVRIAATWFKRLLEDQNNKQVGIILSWDDKVSGVYWVEEREPGLAAILNVELSGEGIKRGLIARNFLDYLKNRYIHKLFTDFNYQFLYAYVSEAGQRLIKAWNDKESVKWKTEGKLPSIRVDGVPYAIPILRLNIKRWIESQ